MKGTGQFVVQSQGVRRSLTLWFQKPCPLWTVIFFFFFWTGPHISKGMKLQKNKRCNIIQVSPAPRRSHLLAVSCVSFRARPVNAVSPVTPPFVFRDFFFFNFLSPGWCGSVDWVQACEPKGRWFDSQSGHMPGLQARSPVGGTKEATTHWCFSPSLSPPFPSV